MALANVESDRAALAPEAVTTLDAMASLAGQTGAVVHVVAARQPGLVEGAQAFAQIAGVGITVDLMPASVRVRFDGSSAA